MRALHSFFVRSLKHRKILPSTLSNIQKQIPRARVLQKNRYKIIYILLYTNLLNCITRDTAIVLKWAFCIARDTVYLNDIQSIKHCFVSVSKSIHSHIRIHETDTTPCVSCYISIHCTVSRLIQHHICCIAVDTAYLYDIHIIRYSFVSVLEMIRARKQTFQRAEYQPQTTHPNTSSRWT